jgi:hypothetical protein
MECKRGQDRYRVRVRVEQVRGTERATTERQVSCYSANAARKEIIMRKSAPARVAKQGPQTWACTLKKGQVRQRKIQSSKGSIRTGNIQQFYALTKRTINLVVEADFHLGQMPL